MLFHGKDFSRNHNLYGKQNNLCTRLCRQAQVSYYYLQLRGTQFSHMERTHY